MASAYSTEQIERFLDLIKLPVRFRPSNSPPRDIAFLTNLHIHMISTVPYENLSLHYSITGRISLDPADLYEKIVVAGRGRGGYCMENSLFLTQILRGLGFQVYPVGVRIRLRKNNVPAGHYVGWVHIVNLVTLSDGSRWMVDVGFGGDGATKPIPLVEGVVTRNLGSQDIRLIRDFIPGQTDRSSPDKKLWIYQYRNGADMEWNSYYAFPELEFLYPDYRVMSWWTSTCPEVFQTFTVLVTLFLRRSNPDVPGDEEIYGKRMMVNGTVKENLGGKTQVVKECKNEEERVEALRQWFGIRLTEEERLGIRGRRADLDAVTP